MTGLRPWVAVTLVFLGTTNVAWAAGEVLTLEDALTLALANNPTVQNAGISVEKAGDQVDATKTRRYPSLNMRVRELRNFVGEGFEFEQGSLGTVSGQPVPEQTRTIDTQSDWTTHVSVEAKQPIIGLYKVSLDIDRLKTYESRTRQDLRSKRQETARNVKEQYYKILETQSALESTQESVAFYQSLAKVVGDRVKQKTELEYQLLDTEAKLAKAEYDGLKQRNTLLTDKERLNEMMGRDIYTPFTVTASLSADETIPEPEKARAIAMEQRPDVKDARLRLRQAEYEMDLRRAAYLPDLDLLASYNRSVNTSLIPDQSFYVGVVARWEFFDWGRRSDEVSKARRSINEAHNDIRRVDARVEAEVNARLRDLQNAKRLVGVATKAQTAAREKLRVTQNRYKQQATLLDNVLKAQSDLATATSDYHEAVLKVWTARANLAKALGEE